ncbi:hypothetical protein GALL_262110 [mine drainage metagenome]|uniref:Lipoprotein n=1 Tax=mine drainage metagenome TaxID=410659 RepID=A0A1J5R772_9ZZZZ
MMRKYGMTRLHFLAGLLFLSGCASSPVEQARTPWEELKQQTRLCLSDVRSDREFSSIADKVTLGGTYDPDVYFELAGIKDRPTAEEKIVIRKWVARLKACYKIKAESYAYEPAGVAKWAAMTDDEQLSLLSEFSRGDLSYGRFAVKRLEIDMKYRGEITRAVSADYKRPENQPQKKDSAIPKAPSDSSSTCGWEGKQWVCRSL